MIAHELAHVRRLDPFVNLVQVAAEALLFYHPAVWWLNRRIRTEREHCCDDIAVAVCDDRIAYARALAELQHHVSAPALAMAVARGPVAERVARLLGVDTVERNRGSRLVASTLCLALAATTGLLLIGGSSVRSAEAAVGLAERAGWLGTTPPKQAATASEIETSTSDATHQTRTFVRSSRTAPAVLSLSPTADRRSTPAAAVISRASRSIKSSSTESAGNCDDSAHSTGSAVEAASAPRASRAASADRHTERKPQDIEELEAYAVHGVTAEYREAMRAAGLNPSADEFVALRIHGVDPDYVHAIRESGFAIDEAEEIIELRIHGVSTSYVRGLRGVGIKIDDREDLVALRIQGVTPEYVRALDALDLEIDVERVMELRAQGITPAFVGELRAQGVERIDDIVAMRVQGATPEFVRGLREAGIDPSPEQIIELRVQGVKPSYVMEMRESGFSFEIDDLIAARVHGITPGFVRRAREHGFEPLDIDRLIRIRDLRLLDYVTVSAE